MVLLFVFVLGYVMFITYKNNDKKKRLEYEINEISIKEEKIKRYKEKLEQYKQLVQQEEGQNAKISELDTLKDKISVEIDSNNVILSELREKYSSL